MDDDKFDINIDELRNLDIGALLNIDLDNTVRPVLRLEDLENIDWENAASYVLGITDPIGQLRDFLASLLSGFVDTIKNLFITVTSPIADLVSKIYDVVSAIPDAFTNLVNTLNNVVLDPIRNIIQFAVNAMGGLKDMFSNLINAVSQAIQSIPNYVSNAVSQITNLFNNVVDNVKNVVTNIANAIASIPNTINDVLSRIGNIVGDVVNKIQGAFSELANRIAQIPSMISDALSKIGTFVSDLSGKVQSVFVEITQRISQIPSVISDVLSKVGSFVGDIASKIQSLFSDLMNRISQIPSTIGDVVGKITSFISDMAGRLQSVFGDIVNKVQQGFGTVFNMLQQAGSVIGDFLNKAKDSITNVLNTIVQNIQNIPNVIKQLIDQVANAFNNFANTVRSGFEWFANQIKQLPDLLRNAVSTFTDWLNKSFEGVRGGFTWLLDQIQHLPDLFNNIIKQIIGAAETAGGVVMNAFKQIGEWIQNATTLLHQVAGALMGFVNTLQRLPEELWNLLPNEIKAAFQAIYDFFTKTIPNTVVNFMNAVQSWWNEFIKDPIKWIGDHIFKPLISFVGQIGDALTQGVKAVMDVLGKAVSSVTSAVRSFVETIFNAILDVARPHSPALLVALLPALLAIVGTFTPALDMISDAMNKEMFDRWVKGAQQVEEILQKGFDEAKGIGYQMWWIGSQLMIPYWQSTVLAFALRGLAKVLGDIKVKFEPEVTGTKLFGFDITLNFGELLTSAAEVLPSYAHAFAMGSSFAIAQLYLQNIQSWYTPRVIQYYETVKDKLFKPIAEKFGVPNALYNAFVRLPGAHEVLEWGRRWIAVLRAKQYQKEDPEEIKDVAISVPQDVAPQDLQTILDTIKLNMIYTGLPKWYIEFNAQDPDKFYLVFVDRFGKDRKVPLSPLYELPTHAELARMTQRDIFPSIKAMQAVTWIRGWNEDISTMMYLLTFKYPPFEKLWQFYMRATSGMLWFSPPSLLRDITNSEADQVGAWPPISPLELQNELGKRGAEAMKTFETAVTTYLKWLEYSHFSWFTPKTEIQGVKIGKQIIDTLGGWTADAWLMWDVSADLPGKIDLRWMSRFGIFQYMAQRLGEDTFKSYKPMVVAIKDMMDLLPSSKLTVELHWFSKMLQSTGLHPAWVPIVTVAENIMAISDEMTLLRTGWINMFKEGLLTFDIMDQALSGLFVVSYRVGYWDPDTKTWNTGWINLPVRWLPHERRLLEYRAVIDRVMDLYREFYGYLRSAVKALIMTPGEAKETLVEFVQMLDKHYSKVVHEITGQEMHLQQDDAYLDLWLNMFAQLGKFEAMERGRMWWNRISGWLLYRIAQGYVDVEKVMQMLQKLKDLLKLTDIEMDAYTTIVKSIYDIISKERVPTPWQMATLAEYMAVPDDLIMKSISMYNIDDQYREFLYRYVKLRPVKPDYRELIMDAVRALRAGKISMDVFNQILEHAKDYGFTEPEIQILKMRGEFLAMLNENIESRSVRVPTPWQLATLAEYMAIPPSLITKSIVEYGLDKDFAEFVARYITVRPLKADYRQVITSAIRALRYGAISRDMFDNILKNALNYGFIEPELALIQLRTELELAVDDAREYVPTPTMLATMAEYVPDVRDYAKEVFKARRISGIWAELWTKYIYLRPIADDVRRWFNAVATLVEHSILPMDALADTLKVLSTYGYEQLEQEIIMRTVLSNRARYAWNELLGTARNLATMARYSDAAADLAWTRVAKVIDALPMDNATKEAVKTMWKQYIIHYQNYPEIRAYVTELVTSYAYGIIDDQTFEKELQYLKQLGVPDMTIALIRRRAQLRRLRVAMTRQQSY